MPLSFTRHRRKELHRRQVLTLLIVTLIFASAAVYLYGSRIKISYTMNQGRQAYQQGNLDQALLEFNRVLAMHANDPAAIDAIGLVYVAQGDLTRAEIKYEQALRQGLRPNGRFNHLHIGNTYLTRGLYGQAEIEFRHALEMTPREANAHLGRALALHALGRVGDAVDEYRKALSLNGDLPLAQAKLAQARRELERGFIYYIYDRRNRPLARIPVAPHVGTRYYPLAQYAAHLVGYVSAEHGAAGLEKLLQNYLPGNSVTLTIDSEWQLAADRALSWHKGSLVALDPKTGELLALVNHPSFNPNTLDEDWRRIARNKNQPLKNRGLENLYTPGSIFKIITAAAVLETDVNMNSIFPVRCNGAERIQGKTFWCWMKHGQVESLQSALDTSCNIAMSEVGNHLGPDRLYEYSSRFGFSTPLAYSFRSDRLNLDFAPTTSLAPMITDDRFEIAERSCGLGSTIAISPLHAALLAATVANDGKMMMPYYIKEIKDIRDEVLGQGQPQVLHTPIKPETAAKLKGFMLDAVEHGIGTRARVRGLSVAGKTGTTGDSEVGLNGWFICYAPAENPKVAVAVYAEKEGTGMDVAAPIARAFLQDIFPQSPQQ